MSTIKQSMTFCLHDEDLDSFSEWLNTIQSHYGVERLNRIRVRLQAEELLLRLRERFNKDVAVEARCEKRFGRLRIQLEVQAKPYNPLGDTGPELGDWDSLLCTTMGITPQYSYVDGKNIIRLPIPHASMNPVVRILIAIVVGVLCGLAGMLVIPPEWRQDITNTILNPTFEMWNRTLNAISGPIVFLTVITTILNTRRIEERGGSSVLVILRYFVISILLVALALVLCTPIFWLKHRSIVFDEQLIRRLIEIMYHIIPSSLFQAFSESDTEQLLFLAFVLGYILIRLGSRVDLLKEIVRQSNMVGLQVASLVSWFVPIMTGGFLCLKVWTGSTGVLVEMWQPLAVSFAVSIAILALVEVSISHVLHVHPALLVRKLWLSFFIAFKTGSLDESFGEAQNCCIYLLGINREYTKVGLPQGLVLYMPVSAIGTIIFTLYIAHANGVQGNGLWYIAAIIMSVVVFVATPPVPGANLLAYVVLFSTLGIPEDALLDAMIFDIVFGIFAGAANQTLLQIEMALQANSFGLLDATLLKRPLSA